LKSTPSETFHKVSLEKQRRILEAAVDELAEHGLLQSSMNRMAQKIGIAKGSLFQYFGNKEGLLEFVFDHAVEQVKKPLRRLRSETEEADFFERIRRSLLLGVGFIQEHPRIYRIYLKMLFQENFPLRERLLQKLHLFSGRYLRPLVEEGVRRGELHQDLDVEMTVFLLDALMDRFLQAYCISFMDAGAGMYQASDEALSRKVDALMTMLRDGLGDPRKNSEAFAQGKTSLGDLFPGKNAS
jgi:AcrR family transcriptional regulator